MTFPSFSPTSFLLLGQKIGLASYFTWYVFIIPETIILFLHLSDASNLKWLIYNSPDVVSTCRLWESSCHRGSFSPAITLCVIRPSTCPCRGITKRKESRGSRGLGSLCWAALLHPGVAPDHSWVKLLLLFWIYIRAKLLDDSKYSPEVSFFFSRKTRELLEHTWQQLSVAPPAAQFLVSQRVGSLALACGWHLCGPRHLYVVRAHHLHLSHVPSYAAESLYGPHTTF